VRVGQFDKTICSHLLQNRPAFGEIVPEFDAEIALDPFKAELEIADESLNDGAPDTVVLIAA